MKWLSALMVVLAAACSGDSVALVCPPAFVPGLVVSAVDSVTGVPVRGPAVVAAKEGTFADSMVVPDGMQVFATLAWERAGTYSVTVRAPNYLSWTKTDVVVKPQGNCGVNQVQVAARLRADTTTTFQLYYAGRGEFADLGLVRATLIAPGFRLDLDSAHLYPKTFGIPTSGRATVRFSLVKAPADTLATQVVTFDLHPNWRYGVSAVISAQRPMSVCGFAVAAGLRSPTGAAVSDSLYVLAAGLPRGAVC